jgi:hypothetical protein
MASCLLLSAYCLLLSAFCSSILILVIVVVEFFFFDDIQLDRIEANNFQLNSALITINYLAFVRVEINMNIGVAFRTCSGRHCCYLQ